MMMLCLRIGSFLCFAGWAWSHLYWEPPYAALFWNESTFEIAQNWLGLTWDEYVGTGAGDGFVQTWLYRFGWFHVACAILSLTAGKESWWQLTLLGLGSAALSLVAIGSYLQSGYELPALIEHGGQVLMPLVLVLGIRFGHRSWLTWSLAIVALITTFVGHGCYAAGFWPTPANFYAMTGLILNVDYETTTQILRFAGYADILICVGIFIPYLRVPSAAYAVLWGLLTALARPVAGMSTELNYWGADLFLHEALIRAPHFLIPLFLLFACFQKTDPAINTKADPPIPDVATAVESG